VSRRRLTWLDVFTSDPLSGNGLAVIHDADGLDDAVMHRVARETRLSETSFIQSASADGGDYTNRIWMPTGEIPFAGHPSLGAAVAMAHERGETAITYVQQTQPGLQPIDVELDGTRARASMLQEPAVVGPLLDPGEALRGVGLPAEVADPALPECVVSCGAPQVLACVRDAALLDRVRPDYEVIGPLLGTHRAITLYVAHVDPATGRVDARAFAGSTDVGEDPATGSAAGPLCAYVADRHGVTAVEIRQGMAMGRPSVLRAEIEGDRPRVGGDVVILISGTLDLDT
jgi:trans-2,3-dihydro-3-hydroxyanthranilate isomerase